MFSWREIFLKIWTAALYRKYRVVGLVTDEHQKCLPAKKQSVYLFSLTGSV